MVNNNRFLSCLATSLAIFLTLFISFDETCWLTPACSQNIPTGNYTLPETVVTATHIPTKPFSSGREVTIIPSEEIRSSGATSLAQVLSSVPGIDVKTRGLPGIQSDISIRGSKNNQVLIMINGIPMNDPQTGHHNMDLPVNLSDIEKIEIVQGGASSVYGANALGGTINIVTKKKKDNNLQYKTSVGSFGLNRQTISGSLELGSWLNTFSGQYEKSSGYTENTDFDKDTLFFSSQRELSLGKLDISFGHQDKDFGANSFYSDRFPNQAEHTQSDLLTMSGDLSLKQFRIKPAIWYREHQDKFLLDKNRPNWQVNQHRTRSLGSRLKVNWKKSNFQLAGGSEWGQENIDSSNLGDHHRYHYGLFFQGRAETRDMAAIDAGLRADYYDRWQWTLSPSLSFSYFPREDITLRAAVNRAFRIPTFTELYYNSPANKGNPNLEPEKGWSYETGIDFMTDISTFKLTLFVRDEDQVIDYQRQSPADPYIAKNYSQVTTYGGTLSAEFKFRHKSDFLSIDRLKFGYSYLDRDKIRESKYLQDYPEHKLDSSLYLKFPWHLRQHLSLQYQDRTELDDFWLLDSRLAKTFSLSPDLQLTLYGEGNNLFNTSYSTIQFVPRPDRWFELGCNLTYSF